MKHLITTAVLVSIASLCFADDPTQESAKATLRQQNSANAQKNVGEWRLMSVQERKEFHDKMQSTKSYEDCKAAYEEHHKQMQERAQQRNQKLAKSHPDMCDKMKNNGKFKESKK